MARAGRPRIQGVKRVNGRLSQRNEDLRARGVLPYDSPVVYFAQGIRGVKVGYTGNVTARMAKLRTDERCNMHLMGCIKCPDAATARRVEGEVHRLLKAEDRWITGEWFEIGPNAVAKILHAYETQGFERVGQEADDRLPIENGMMVNTATGLSKSILTPLKAKI